MKQYEVHMGPKECSYQKHLCDSKHEEKSKYSMWDIPRFNLPGFFKKLMP